MPAKKDEKEIKDKPVGRSAHTLAFASECVGGRMPRMASLPVNDSYRVEVRQGVDSLWVLLRRGDDGGVALRTAYAPGPPLKAEVVEETGTALELRVGSTTGTFRVRVEVLDPATASGKPLIRCQTFLTVLQDTMMSYWPRDLYVFDGDGDPFRTEGTVKTAQRGLNAGMLLANLKRPNFGSLLYWQDLTVLNPYFRATGTKPGGAVGGQWPELGFQLPVSAEKPLPGGQEFALSDAYFHWDEKMEEDERATAAQFLELLAEIYPHLAKPDTIFRPWPQKAADTLHDLEKSGLATVNEHGYLYLHPYTGTEYPDSMVQLTVTAALKEFAEWKGEDVPLVGELRKGVRNFYDPQLNTIRRYLPSVGDDKDDDAVDSWYLMHPLTNLGRFAKDGDEEARELFLKAVEFALKAAQHFEYEFPIMFNVENFNVITQSREDGLGQTDAAGLYAYVMLQAYELTGQDRYLTEARNGLDAMSGLKFETVYQTNLTAWTMVACLKFWRITGEEKYRDQSFVSYAGFLNNSIVWESDLGTAEHFQTFSAVTCLHDAPYMAIYECYESYAAFLEYLDIGGDDLPESVRLLLTEYAKYTLSRAWGYYPKELPEDALAKEIRNGHIERALAFPLEDLYPDGQPAGQVGQEIYGCGAAFAFTVRAYHRLKNAPLTLFCEYPIFALKEDEEKNQVSFWTRGVERMTCKVRLVTEGKAPAPTVTANGKKVKVAATEEGQPEFAVPGGTEVIITWGAAA